MSIFQRSFKFYLLFVISLFVMSCKQTPEVLKEDLPFDQERWLVKEGQDYPYRAQMLKDVVYNDTVRTLNKAEILELFGKPDKEQENHLYYLISQKRIDLWPLHTTNMVIKFANEDSIEWIKIHE